MNYFKTADVEYLKGRKARLEQRLEAAEASVKRHEGVKGYGNETWLAMFQDRVIETKQAIYEINLKLEGV